MKPNFSWTSENSEKERDEVFDILSKQLSKEDLESESVYKLKTLADNQHLLELFDSMVIKNKVISEDEFW